MKKIILIMAGALLFATSCTIIGPSKKELSDALAEEENYQREEEEMRVSKERDKNVYLMLLDLSNRKTMVEQKIEGGYTTVYIDPGVPVKSIMDINLDLINTLLGWLDNTYSIDGDSPNSLEQKAMLIDLKDGFINGPWSEQEIMDSLIEIANILHEVTELTSLSFFTSYKKLGENIIGFKTNYIPQASRLDQLNTICIIKKQSSKDVL